MRDSGGLARNKYGFGYYKQYDRAEIRLLGQLGRILIFFCNQESCPGGVKFRETGTLNRAAISIKQASQKGDVCTRSGGCVEYKRPSWTNSAPQLTILKTCRPLLNPHTIAIAQKGLILVSFPGDSEPEMGRVIGCGKHPTRRPTFASVGRPG